MSSIKQGIVDNIQLAIENGWTLRPCGKNGRFVNINHQTGIKLSDASHILEDVDDLAKFPDEVSSVALVAVHLKDVNFVCLDFDIEDAQLKQKILDLLLTRYRKEDLFWRIGNPNRLGQFWFQTETLLKHNSANKFDLIVHEKRCNAIGIYKNTELLYEWPYKRPWQQTPDDLPYISENFLEGFFELLGASNKKTNNTGSRHDALKDLIFKKVNMPGFLNIVQDVITTPEYISLESERDAKNEITRLFNWAVEQTIENYHDISGLFKDENDELLTEFMVDNSPEVERNSFIDILYRAIIRNQYTNNKKLAFFTALSISSWLLSFSSRFEGLAPNLMILYVAHSGAGKSTSSKAIREIVKLCKKLQPSFMGNDIRTEASLYSGLETAPNPFYLIDEFTKLFKSQKNKNSYTSNLTEILCQLYSDYKDDDLHSIKLKESSYGVCYGPKINIMGFSTPEIWKIFDESTFSQGIGRRIFAVNDDSISFAKKNVEYNPEFFTDSERKLIETFIQNFVMPKEDFLYIPDSVKSYELIKGKDAKGKVVKWDEATSFNIIFKLTSSEEVSDYFKDKFVDKINKLKKMSLKSGNELSLFITNSMPEFVKKLALIHTLAGKKFIDKNEKGYLDIKVRTKVEMDSVEWAEKMYLYYMVNGLNYDLESIYKKDLKENQVINLGNSLIEKLIEKDVQEFMISEEPVKSFFKGNGNLKTDVINSLILRNKIEKITKKASKRGAKYRVINDQY